VRFQVAELEEQVRAVTAQRRQAERAAAEVLAILESQGFGGHLSDGVADEDSDSDRDGERQDGDDAKGRGDTARATGEEEPAVAKGEAEDALSGTAQPGGLSWRGRSVSPRKARQLKHKHGRRYFYLLSSGDSSPKYRMGQSCRKNKTRVELMRCCRLALELLHLRSSTVHFLPDNLSSSDQQRQQVGGTGRWRWWRGESQAAARWVGCHGRWPGGHGRRGGRR
jgi:hypothetical protein